MTDTPKKWSFKLPGWKTLFKYGAILGVTGVVSAGVLIIWALLYYGRDLPDYRQLAEYEPSVMTRVHAGDGRLLKEYARERRLFVPYEVIPEKLIQAFLAAEDKNFFNHNGLDYMGMVRGNIRNVMNLVQGRPLQGGSTISQQVARNFLLTLDQRLDRKIKEIILTLRMERAYSKERILELYLNEINFGIAYGVAAASLNYFNKPLNELTTAEMAYLAALPKAPNRYHPVRHKARATGRRDWVLSRMHILGYIDDAEYRDAVATELTMIPRTRQSDFRADYFTEEVRRKLLRIYGEKALYEGGLSVRTTLEPEMQGYAEQRLREGLVAYDRRHGWRGPVTRISVDGDWVTRLKAQKKALGFKQWQLALVHEVRGDGAIVGFKDGAYGFIPFDEVTWARKWRVGETLGPKIKDTGEVLSMGDVVITRILPSKGTYTVSDFITEQGEFTGDVPVYGLRQLPAVNGAVIALDPHTGRVLAMAGGFDYGASEYNRATQAERQPGSAFKPFVYAAALDQGFTPASLVLDAPFVMDQGYGQGMWKPKNSSNKFYGPSTLRLGIEKSRNLMTVRLAQNIGMRTVTYYAEKFGLDANIQETLAASLGAGEVTLLDLTAAYGMLVNGGKNIDPTFIDRIQDRRGKTIYRHDERACEACNAINTTRTPDQRAEPFLEDDRAQVIDPLTAFQMVSMMEGVVQNGTGRKIKALGKPFAGKTGTTNDSADAWFIGFSPDLAVGVFVGFDRRRSLGRFEEGSSVAVPIFRDFMKDVYADKPGIPFRAPAGIRMVWVNAETGEPARPGDKSVILEAFKPGTEPRFGKLSVLDGSLNAATTGSAVRKGTGGIY